MCERKLASEVTVKEYGVETHGRSMCDTPEQGREAINEILDGWKELIASGNAKNISLQLVYTDSDSRVGIHQAKMNPEYKPPKDKTPKRFLVSDDGISLDTVKARDTVKLYNTLCEHARIFVNDNEGFYEDGDYDERVQQLVLDNFNDHWTIQVNKK